MRCLVVYGKEDMMARRLKKNNSVVGEMTCCDRVL